MAVTGRRSTLLLLVMAAASFAQTPQEVLRAVNRITTGLADNDAKAAMDGFDPAFADYEKLSSYLQNLTASYYLTNEADIVSEEDGETETKLTLDWALTLRSQGTQDTVQRRQQVQMVLKREKSGWTIVDFSPIDLFDPQNAAAK